MRISSKKIITFDMGTYTSSAWLWESYHFITNDKWVWFTLSRSQSYEWNNSMMNGFEIPFGLVKRAFFLNSISA